MNNPYFFQVLVALVLLLLSLANLYLGKSLLALHLNKMHVFMYFLLTVLLAFGMFSTINGLPLAAQISRFCVFWFVVQIVILPIAFILFAAKLAVYYFAGLSLTGLLHGTFLATVATAVCISAYGAYYESTAIRTVRYDIPLFNLDESSDGFKVVQLTDLHIGPYFSTADLQTVLEKAFEEQPDVLVITGDLIDDVSRLQETTAILDSFADSFPHGIYYCWGNHEYFRNYGAISQALAKSKVQVLKNQCDLLLDGEIPLYVLGVDYSFNRIGGAEQEYDAMLEKTLAEVKNSSTKILLAHHSAVIDNAFANNIDLTLTGHTHGLQVKLVSKIFAHAFKYMRGMYVQDNLYGYVSTGVNGWFPFRFDCPPEIAVFTLKKH